MVYLIIFIFNLPGLLLLAGAVRQVVRDNDRLTRLQVEGAAMVVVGMLSRWLVFDANFGIDRFEQYRWSYWFHRAEPGLFWIGLLFAMLGFYLSRRPRPGLRPWPLVGKAVVALGILAGTGLALLAEKHLGLAFIDLPYDVSRLFFLLGLFPFCIGYVLSSFRAVTPPQFKAEGE